MYRREMQVQNKWRTIVFIEQVKKEANMHRHVVAVGDSVRKLRREYCNALRTAGYGDLHVSKPHIAITHVLKRLKPTSYIAE